MPIRKNSKGLPRIVVALLTLGIGSFAVSELLAFDRDIHSSSTERILRALGFDDEAAELVGMANSGTDIDEPNTSAAHADNNQLGAASARLVAKRTEIGNFLNTCERRKALGSLGQALHTVQDVYSHSNSIDNDIPIPDLLAMTNGTANCALPAFAPDGLVTGYFNLFGPPPFFQCRGIGPNQCCHRDLNKDNTGVPNGGNHADALKAAETATGTYVGLVEENIRARFPAADATQFLKMLKEKQRTQIFVIDDTGSMSEDIAGVIASANSTLDSLLASGEAPTLGLVTFKDDVSNFGKVCSIETVRSQINGLSADGGGDCPEASNQALLTAMGEVPFLESDVQLRGGRLLLATDASAGDAHLGPVVAAQAVVRGVSIDVVLTGDCASEERELDARVPANASLNDPGAPKQPLDSSKAGTDPLTSASARTQLRALADATGGVLFNVERVEVEDVVPTLLELGNPDNALLTSRRVDLVAGSPVELTVTVDDELAEKVTFMVTASSAGILPNVSVTRPNGSPALPADPDVSFRSLSSVISYAVSAPAAGVWRIRLEGEGSFRFRTFGGTPFRLSSLRLQKEAVGPHRPEAELVPIEGQPVAGSRIFGDLSFTAPPQTLRVFLRRPDGTLLQELKAAALEDDRHFRTQLTVPGETFVFEATGLTPKGAAFVRQITVPVNPQTVGLSALAPTIEAAPGSTARIGVTVLNASSGSGTFRLSASGSKGWGLTVPPEFTLAAGASTSLEIEVTVPASAATGDSDELAILVENVATPQVRNSAVVRIAVVGAQVDLQVSVADSGDPVVAGSGPGNLTYVVTVTNQGSAGATGVQLSETHFLPTGVTLDSIVPSGSTTFASPVWTVGSLAAGASETLTLHLTVGPTAPPGASVSAGASVTATNEPLANPGDDADSESTVIAPGAIAEIPTMSGAGLLLLALALLTLGVVQVRRSARRRGV